MTSSIDPAVPADGAVVAKSAVRANFQAAHDEIEDLQPILSSALPTSGTIQIDLTKQGLRLYPDLVLSGASTLAVAANPVEGAIARFSLAGNGFALGWDGIRFGDAPTVLVSSQPSWIPTNFPGTSATATWTLTVAHINGRTLMWPSPSWPVVGLPNAGLDLSVKSIVGSAPLASEAQWPAPRYDWSVREREPTITSGRVTTVVDLAGSANLTEVGTSGPTLQAAMPRGLSFVGSGDTGNAMAATTALVSTLFPGTNAFHCVMIFTVVSIQTSSASVFPAYSTDPIICDRIDTGDGSGGFLSAGVQLVNGVPTLVATIYDGGPKNISTTIALGRPEIVEWWWDGSNMRLRRAGGAVVGPVAAGAPSTQTGYIRLGRNWNQTTHSTVVIHRIRLATRLPGHHIVARGTLTPRAGALDLSDATVGHVLTGQAGGAAAFAAPAVSTAYVDGGDAATLASAESHANGLDAAMDARVDVLESGDRNGGALFDYTTAPHVPGVSGTLTQAAHGGRPVLITGTVTVPVTDGFVCLLRNKSGSAQTVQPASGALVHEGTTKASINLPTNREVAVHGDGTDVWVSGEIGS